MKAIGQILVDIAEQTATPALVTDFKIVKKMFLEAYCRSVHTLSKKRCRLPQFISRVLSPKVFRNQLSA